MTRNPSLVKQLRIQSAAPFDFSLPTGSCAQSLSFNGSAIHSETLGPSFQVHRNSHRKRGWHHGTELRRHSSRHLVTPGDRVLRPHEMKQKIRKPGRIWICQMPQKVDTSFQFVTRYAAKQPAPAWTIDSPLRYF
jgi:hypothetical protein